MTVTTNDLYESAYYLLHGCELVEIEGSRAGGKILCNLILSGPAITQLQLDYLNGKATANILDLRRTMGRLHAWVSRARKKFKRQQQPREVHP